VLVLSEKIASSRRSVSWGAARKNGTMKSRGEARRGQFVRSSHRASLSFISLRQPKLNLVTKAQKTQLSNGALR